MSFSVLLGYGLILIGGGTLVYIFARTRHMPAMAGVRSDEQIVSKPTDTLSPHADRREALEVIEHQQTVRLLGETSERAVQATVTLDAMTETNGRWHETGAAYRALELAGGVWIFKIPSREGGDSIWVKAERLNAPEQLESFFKGTKGNPGPARLFHQNGQTKPVQFTLPSSFEDSADYEVVDIGRFATTIDGAEDVFRTGDQYPFVTSQRGDKEGILLYLDARKNMARGLGGLFRGEVFEPDVDIASLL